MAVSHLPPLRSKLLALAAVGVVPMVILSLVLAYVLIDHEKETLREAARARNHTFLTAVDAQMRGYLGTLRALAASASLEAGDFTTFDAEARRVLASQAPEWRNILLLNTTGVQVLNLRYPPGATPTNEAQLDNPGFRQVLATGSRMSATSIPGRHRRSRYRGADAGAPGWGAALRARIHCGAVRPGEAHAGAAVSGLVGDGAGRSQRPFHRTPARSTGRSACFAGFLEPRSTRAAEGWYRGKTLEGWDTYTDYKTSALTGWTVGLAIPSSEINAAAYRASVYMVLGHIRVAAVGGGFRLLAIALLRGTDSHAGGCGAAHWP